MHALSVLTLTVTTGFTLGVLASAPPATAGPAATALDCFFSGPRYPALSPSSRPGSRYVVFIRRRLTCDEARSVALRGTRSPNPGPFRPFTLTGGWQCVSWAPPTLGKIIAGQCTKPGSGALVNWSPACDPDASRACKNLRRGS